MRKLILLTAVVFVVTNAYALSKTELDTDIKATLDKCYAEVKGCKEIAEKSAGVLVFPEVTKGGLGIAYETGKGALLENGRNTGYYETSAASIGATIGVGSKSIVVALRTPEEVTKLKKSSGWDVGADAGVAMLETGKAGTLDTSNIKESVVGIIFGESGVLADASIKGSKISAIEAKDIG